MRPWLPFALTVAVVLILESSVGIWPSDRFGNVATRAIGGWAGLLALGLIWSAGIVLSLGKAIALRDPLWAVIGGVSSIVGLVYFPEWARRVALPTQGGISPHELLDVMFPFVGISALFGFALASLLVVALERYRGRASSRVTPPSAPRKR
jgi:hypothetical protein